MQYNKLFIIGAHIALFVMSIGGGILLSLFELIIRISSLASYRTIYMRFKDGTIPIPDDRRSELFRLINVKAGIPQASVGTILFIASLITYAIFVFKVPKKTSMKLFAAHNIIAIFSMISFAFTVSNLFICNGIHGTYYPLFNYSDTMMAFGTLNDCYFGISYGYIGLSSYPLLFIIQIIIITCDIIRTFMVKSKPVYKLEEPAEELEE